MEQFELFIISTYAAVRLFQIPWLDQAVPAWLRLAALSLLSASGIVAIGLLCLAAVQSLQLPVKADPRMPTGVPGASRH